MTLDDDFNDFPISLVAIKDCWIWSSFSALSVSIGRVIVIESCDSDGIAQISAGPFSGYFECPFENINFNDFEVIE